MRISGGAARGIPLSVPSGDAVRPATDGLRQALFSSLAPRIAGARFVDLFAGSGAYGLEALSRGAESGIFVERHARTAGLIRQNLAAVARSLRREPRDLGEIVAADAVTWSPRPGTPPADLVFIDPPYEDKRDYSHVAQVLADALTRFPTGTYAVWYPVLQRNESRQLPERLKRLGAKSWLNVTLAIHGPAPDGFGLHNSGMFILNPPWTLEAQLKEVMPWLIEVLGVDDTAEYVLESGEN